MRVDVVSPVGSLSARDAYGPVRGVIYELIRGQDPDLATELHDSGWRGHSLRPMGALPPALPPGSTTGRLWFGSPVPRIADAFTSALGSRAELRWGGTHLAIGAITRDGGRDHSSGDVVFTTASPVVVRHESRYILPDDPRYRDRLVHNTRHKADVLGLPSDVDIEILGAGPRRSVRMPKRSLRIGACLRLRVRAAPPLLDALHEWGLGLNTNQGFGWIT